MAGKKKTAHDELNGSNLDSLPEELLVSILDRLNWKDSAAISTLSHSFHHAFLQKTILNLEDNTSPRSCLKFVESVNRFLQTHKGPKVDSLRIAFDDFYPAMQPPENDDSDEFMSEYLKDGLENVDFMEEKYFESWLAFARAKCVRRLDIHFWHSWYVRDGVRPQLRTFEGFANLTALSLKSVRVADADLENGLNIHLVNLESLFLENTRGIEAMVISSSTLKKLEIRDCYGFHHLQIDQAPNLECFKHHDMHYDLWMPDAEFQLVHVPKLSHVFLGGDELCRESLWELQYAGMLATLELDMTVRCSSRQEFEYMKLPPQFPPLHNLKQLQFKFEMNDKRGPMILIFQNILYACPKLQKMTLIYDIWIEKDDWHWPYIEKDVSFRHGCLREVEFIGWCGQENEIEAVSFLKEIARLKRIRLRKSGASSL